MKYLLLFFEGILTFISPCILPMLPLYVSYFIGNQEVRQTASKKKVAGNALLFILGFSMIFILMHAFVSTVGHFVLEHRDWIQIIAGAWIILLGIDFLLDNRWSSRIHLGSNTIKRPVSSFGFGVAFAISWTPCVGTFLGVVLSQTALETNYWQSISLMLAYCLGLGLPFLLTALILDEMEQSFKWLKQHSQQIRRGSGILLIVLGVAILFGWYTQLMQWLNYI